MNLELNESMNFQSMLTALKSKLPNYVIELKKNPIARFEYLQVRKSAYVGVWIRILPGKNKVVLIKTIPSTMARALLGGLIAMLIASAAQQKLVNEIAQVLMAEFKTKPL
jgi:hypothetical protein